MDRDSLYLQNLQGPEGESDTQKDNGKTTVGCKDEPMLDVEIDQMCNGGELKAGSQLSGLCKQGNDGSVH